MLDMPSPSSVVRDAWKYTCQLNGTVGVNCTRWSEGVSAVHPAASAQRSRDGFRLLGNISVSGSSDQRDVTITALVAGKEIAMMQRHLAVADCCGRYLKHVPHLDH